MRARILVGDCLARMRDIPDSSVSCCVTSPPYWGLRDYGVDGQIGLEETPSAYVERLVAVFRDVRRCLRDDGTLWLNLGDSYAGSSSSGTSDGRSSTLGPKRDGLPGNKAWMVPHGAKSVPTGLKPKDLVGIPWMVARALQAPFYTGRIARERDRVWLAATLDAEGTICGFDHTRADDGSHRSGVHVAITNTSPLMLDEAARIWPASRSAHQRPHAGHLGKRDSWRWIVHGTENKLAALRELYPYLIVKRKQAVVAYSLLLLMADAKRLGHSAQKDDVLAKRRVLTGLLSALNRGTAADLPDWLKEPTGLYEPGWWLRSDIIWSKPNPMPESVTDRPTKAHEYVFLLSKSERYYFDAEAIAEVSVMPAGTAGSWNGNRDFGLPGGATRFGKPNLGGSIDGTRNARTVWEITTQPFSGAHFATMPPALAERCIRAGSAEGGTILDPFGGAGTTALVAAKLGRDSIVTELNPEYARIAQRRIEDAMGLLCPVSVEP